jgi:uncharacterized glyoxalase superfamily protein PhnB
MKITELRPMLWTADLNETIAFYEQVLGFLCTAKNEDWGWATLRIDDVAIMAAEPTAHSSFESPTFTGSFYFTTDDVDAMWSKLKDKARVCYGIENFEYGMREFAVYDNNGYLLQFGQELK